MSEFKNKKIIVGIINLNLNNIFSIFNGVKDLGFKVEIIKKQKKIKSDILVLPGVGSFPKAMELLKKTELDKRIIEFSNSYNPLIGICLGMQLLFDKSEEFKKTKGLSLISGKVKKISNQKTIVPNIGWEKIQIVKKNPLIKKNFNNKHFYFTHSYHCVPKYKDDILSFTKINDFKFCSSVKKKKYIWDAIPS